MTSDLAHVAGGSTPARVFIGSSGLSLPTSESLRLRADHAAARDAVAAVLDPVDGPLSALDPILTSSCATTPAEHLLRPDLGRRFDAASAERIRADATDAVDVQLLVGDGLSAGAVEDGAVALCEELRARLSDRGLTCGRPILVRHCRVGIMNHFGELVAPATVVLLIGERPGLATDRSMSAYLAHRPRVGHTDADRNCISNIHGGGVSTADAAERIVALIEEMRRAGTSGVTVKEPDPGTDGTPQVR